MTFVEVGVRFLDSLLLLRGFNLFAKDDDLLKEEDVSLMAAGEKGATDTGTTVPHVERILHSHMIY